MIYIVKSLLSLSIYISLFVKLFDNKLTLQFLNIEIRSGSCNTAESEHMPAWARTRTHPLFWLYLPSKTCIMYTHTQSPQFITPCLPQSAVWSTRLRQLPSVQTDPPHGTMAGTLKTTQDEMLGLSRLYSFRFILCRGLFMSTRTSTYTKIICIKKNNNSTSVNWWSEYILHESDFLSLVLLQIVKSSEFLVLR